MSKTNYESTDPAAVELGWKLKRISDTHEMRQRKLTEEFRKRSEELTTASQQEQTAAFEELAALVGVSKEEYGDSMDWALNIADIADGKVALVNKAEAQKAAEECDCPVCTIRRALRIGDVDQDDDGDDDEQVVMH